MNIHPLQWRTSTNTKLGKCPALLFHWDYSFINILNQFLFLYFLFHIKVLSSMLYLLLLLVFVFFLNLYLFVSLVLVKLSEN